MNIAVLISKIPEPVNERINLLAVFLGKSGSPGMSGLDKYVIEEGVRLKERLGTGQVIAITAGPPGRQKILREAISMGCDNAILVQDKDIYDVKRYGVDLSRVLSKAIKKIGNIDLVLCATDISDEITGYLGKEVSEHLDMKRIEAVTAIKGVGLENIIVNRKTQEGYAVTEVSFPAVVTVNGQINTPRVPSAKDKIKARRKQIPIWSMEELDPLKRTFTHDKNTVNSGQNFSSIKEIAGKQPDSYERYEVPADDMDKESRISPVYARQEETEKINDGDNPLSEINRQERTEQQMLEEHVDNMSPAKEKKGGGTHNERGGGKSLDFLGYWGLTEKPFENTGNIRYFYYSPTHKEALVRLIYVIKQNKAGAMLAGGYGTGKTTIAKEILTEIEQNDSYKSVYISNPMINSTELLQEVAYQLGCNGSDESRLILRRHIAGKLEAIASHGDHTVILVDEAHLITRKDALEELRLFMNLQKKDKFLASIVLMGQLVLMDIINAMPQFKQRFAMCYVLKQLDEEETRRYVKHRLKIAGTDKDIFTSEAFSLIYRSSEGRPRQINNICDMALLIGCMRNIDKIDDEMIREIVKDLGQEL
jgi:type II secretory pathway predicted ATPase ExeA/electron transfer flavoprotein alpha/beta subunit